MKYDQHLPSLLLLPAPPAPASRESMSAAYGPPLDAAIATAASETLAPRAVWIEPNNTAVVDLATFAAAYHPWRTIFHCSTEAGLGLFSDYLRLAEGRQVLRQDQLVAVDGGLTMNVSAAGAAAAPKEADVGQHRTVCIGGTFDHLHAGHKLLLTGGALLLDMPRVEEGAPSSEKPARFIVGVTGDELLRNKKHADLVEPWDRRARGVIDFLSTLLELRPTGWKEAKEGDDGQQEQQQQQGATSSCYNIVEADGDFRASFRDGAVSVECVRIQDAFGPTITMPELSSLVVSAETRSGGQAVNDKRAGLGWAPLQILEVDVLDAGSGEGHDAEQPTQTGDFASKISSTAIRQALSESRP
ncbi:pantetheine-phosphate adenylyltransferase [Magnaporthiopsis poae ATCC 64411]|uniref:Pantetheine-phosphate adenylyltransferase n=1 Tax=Magnaporthiopsis poae (strain ATCC 64411 / 73-15) TaxID=644358 RepID=A0A0C4E5A5_MAGP6|nr:pantetheine-phosphate adenylyltransferase [Magnaporthiopsis poae ATCC 64411]